MGVDELLIVVRSVRVGVTRSEVGVSSFGQEVIG